MTDERVAIVSCGIFARELRLLSPGLGRGHRLIFLDSLLHMRPGLLEEAVRRSLDEADPGPVVLVYGDCCPRMFDLASAPGRRRVDGTNCIEIALGSARYRALVKEGAFFFMPEWLARWREVFDFELGLSDPTLARSFMREMATCLVYVDTGCVEPPRAILEEVSRHLDLPWRIESCGLAGIESAVKAALASPEAGP